MAVICIATGSFFILSRRYLNRIVLKAGKADLYKKTTTSISAVMYPVVGVLLIGYILLNWHKMPPENAPIGYFFMASGVLAILYGAHCWYKKSRTNRASSATLPTPTRDR